MRARYWLLTLLVLAFPRSAAAQLDPVGNFDWCVVQPFAAAATSITVEPTGCGATLPSTAFNLSVCQVTDHPSNCRTTAGVEDTSAEVVRVTAGFGTDTFTISRAQEGTSDVNHNTGGKTYVVSTFTAKTITDVNTALGASNVTLGTNSILTNERVLTGSTGIAVTDGGAGSTVTLDLDATLDAVAGYNTNGLLTQTAADTFTGRTITGTSDQVNVSNGNGVSGNPTLSLPQSIATTSTPTFGGLALTGSVVDLLNITNSGSTAPAVHIQGSGTSMAVFQDMYTAAGATQPVYRYRTARGSSAAPRRVNTGDLMGNIQWMGAEAVDDSTDATWTGNGAVLRATSLDNWTSSARGAKIEFLTAASGSTTNSVRAHIDSTGIVFPSTSGLYGTTTLNLGVGTTSYASISANIFSLAANTQIYGTDGEINIWPETGSVGGTAQLKVENNPIEPGGGTEKHETDLYLYGKRDSVTNYFTGAVTFGATDASNVGSAHSMLSEGNWTNAGGFTLRRFAIYDHELDTEILMHQSSELGIVNIGRVTSGKGMGIRLSGLDVNTHADGTTASLNAQADFISNDTNTRTYYGSRGYYTLNTGGSNTNKTLHLDDVDTVNTAVTGTTTTLWRRGYGGTERARLTSVGNLKIGGTADRGTTEGTNQIVVFCGTPPSGSLSSGISHYCDSSGEARVKDAAGIEAMLTPHNKALTDNSATSVLSMTVAASTGIGGVLEYTIEAYDGTDIQVETGQVIITAVNKAATITAAVTEVNSQQSVSAGTLTTAWTISAATPAVISVNANTSLSPSGGYPRITFRLVDNMGRQAFTLP